MTDVMEPGADTTPSGEPGGASRRRHLGRRAKLLIGLAAGVILVAGLGALWVVRQIDPPGPPGAEVTVEIPEGSSASRIAALLEDEGVITSSRVFRIYIRVTGAGEFRAGLYGRGEFRENMAMADVVSVLESGPQIRYERLTIPEGFTLDQIAAKVGELPGLSAERFLELAESGTVRSRFQPEAVTSLEGLLFPDTYQIAETESEEDVLSRMVELFDATAVEVGLEAGAQELGMTPYEAAIVASLVEEETKVADERTLVSAVIHNRLERGMLLQIDATVLYALGEHKNRVLFSDLEVDSPYNTYRYAGLPPTPIAAPGAEALRAAVAPADVDYLYYVKTADDGSHAFATTAAEHSQNVADARRRGIR